MDIRMLLLVSALFLPLAASADVGGTLEPLSCGIYNQQVAPYIEQELETQSPERSRYTMVMKTRNGKQLAVEVKSVQIQMAGERNQVSVFLDGLPLAKTSHQDVPLYLEVHVGEMMHRIICTRTDKIGQQVLPETGNKK